MTLEIRCSANVAESVSDEQRCCVRSDLGRSIGHHDVFYSVFGPVCYAIFLAQICSNREPANIVVIHAP